MMKIVSFVNFLKLKHRFRIKTYANDEPQRFHNTEKCDPNQFKMVSVRTFAALLPVTFDGLTVFSFDYDSFFVND